MESKHWLLRIGDGQHFISSSSKYIWGVNSSDKGNVVPFLTHAKPGDILWFVKSKSKGQLIAVATFTEFKKRELGPLISLTATNEELGWTIQTGNWDIEVHYKELYNLTDCNLFSEIKSPKVVRLYNEKCKVILPLEYPYIVKYSRVLRIM
jgi:hypothetical protein